MKHWTIAKRIFLGGFLLLALLMGVAVVGVLALHGTKNLAVERLRNDAIPGIVNMAEMNTQTLRGHIRVLMAGQATDQKERDAHVSALQTNAAKAAEASKLYEASMSLEEDRTNFHKLQQLQVSYLEERENYLTMLTSGRVAEASIYVGEKLDPAYVAYRGQMAEMLTWNQGAVSAATEEIIGKAEQATNQTLVLAGASLLIALSAGWIIIRGINRSLREMSGVLDDAANQLASAAGQVSSNSQALAEGASEQAASLEETSSSIEELTSMTRRNADGAVHAKQLSSETRATAETGNQDMAEMRQAMEAIKTSSSDISKIIKTIDEIAFQTNILALNAAVEAARAGEAGAGFAVVADEVRALAQRSAASAKETADKIEIAINRGETGVRISDKVAQSLAQIVQKVRQVDELVGEISVASQEQTQGLGQINTAISQMDKVTQSNAGNAEETAAAAEELNAQSSTLKDTVGDLRQLVGGGSGTASPIARRAAKQPAAPASRSSAATNAKTARATGTKSSVGAPALAHASASADGDSFFHN